MIDRTAVPYLAGFMVCVGSVLVLAACTSGGNDRAAAAGDRTIAAVAEL